MKISISYFSNIASIKTDLITIFVFSNKKLFNNQFNSLKKYFPIEIDRIVKLEKFKGEFDSFSLFYTNKNFLTPRIQLIGLGDIEKINYEVLRKASATATLNAKKFKIKQLSFLFPTLPENLSIAYSAQSIFEGSVLSQYKFDEFKTTNKSETSFKEIKILYDNKTYKNKLEQARKNSEIICEGVFLARDLSNLPSSKLYPEILAKYAIQSAKKYGYRAEVWDERKIKKMGFGGLTAVSSGSIHPARFIILNYKGNKSKNSNIVLIGKGITFDSGGISLKPADRMSEMKMDMSGAASVIGVIQSAARMKLAVNLIGLIPACENMPGGSAFKPGDIIEHYGGKTSEVENTDAEGRLILADALSFAHKFNPEIVIDIATLTGAVITALGHHITAIMGNNKNYISKIKDAGELTYERVWELPLYDEYKKQIKSNIADVKNIGSKGAGAITAAMFLKHFISDKKGNEYPWIHLDIAGTAIVDEVNYYIQPGATGVGIRLLIEFLKSHININN